MSDRPVQRRVGLRVSGFEKLARATVRHQAPRASEIVSQQPVVVDHLRGIRHISGAAAHETARAVGGGFPETGALHQCAAQGLIAQAFRHSGAPA